MSMSSATLTSPLLRSPPRPADPVDALFGGIGPLSAAICGRALPPVAAAAPPQGDGSPKKRARSASPRRARTPPPLSRRLLGAVAEEVDRCIFANAARHPQGRQVINRLSLLEFIGLADPAAPFPPPSPSSPEDSLPFHAGAVRTRESYSPGADGRPERDDEDRDFEGAPRRWAVPLYGEDGLVLLAGGRRGTYPEWYTEAVAQTLALWERQAEQGRRLLTRREEVAAEIAAKWRHSLLFGPEGAPGTGGAPPSECRAPVRRRPAGAPARSAPWPALRLGRAAPSSAGPAESAP